MRFPTMMGRWTVFIFCTIFVYGAWNESDPCVSNQVIEGDERSAVLAEKSGYKCDDNLRKGWYRFVSNRGLPMEIVTERVSVNRCGTYASVWLNTQHPSADEGIVTGEVCANINNINVECPWPWTIRIKNCGEFYVYWLIPTRYCPMRYCTSISLR